MSRPGRPRTITDKQVERAAALIREGSTIQAAADKVGCVSSSLRYRLGRHSGGHNNGERGGTPQFVTEHGLDTELEPGEIPVFVRDYREQHAHYVYPLGDIHKGSPNHAGEKWRSWLGWIAEQKDVSMLGTGDFLNAALTTSVSDTYEETSSVGVAKRELRQELKPLAYGDKIDLLIPGNHEARVHKAIGDCPIEDVADALEVNYSKAAAVVVYLVGDQRYELFVRHGSGSGRASAQAGRLEREAQIIVADVYVQGHTHRQQTINGVVFEVQDDQVVRRRQKFITSGSFLTYENYAAGMGLAPADIGAPRIRFDGTRKRVFASA